MERPAGNQGQLTCFGSDARITATAFLLKGLTANEAQEGTFIQSILPLCRLILRRCVLSKELTLNLR